MFRAKEERDCLICAWRLLECCTVPSAECCTVPSAECCTVPSAECCTVPSAECCTVPSAECCTVPSAECSGDGTSTLTSRTTHVLLQDSVSVCARIALSSHFHLSHLKWFCKTDLYLHQGHMIIAECIQKSSACGLRISQHNTC